VRATLCAAMPALTVTAAGAADDLERALLAKTLCRLRPTNSSARERCNPNVAPRLFWRPQVVALFGASPSFVYQSPLWGYQHLVPSWPGALNVHDGRASG
jgi:hypothetical protein